MMNMGMGYDAAHSLRDRILTCLLSVGRKTIEKRDKCFHTSHPPLISASDTAMNVHFLFSASPHTLDLGP